MNTLFLTLFRPVKAFNQLKTESFSAMSLLMIILLVIINLILMIPVTEKVLQITTASMPLNSDQLEMMAQVSHTMRYVQIFGSIITSIVMFLFYALLLYLLVLISKSKLDFKKALQLIICCYIALAIGSLVNTAFLYMRGIDAIQHIYDITLTGINLLTSTDKVGMTMYVFLSYINLFQLWFVALISIGLTILADMKPVKATIISILFWLVTVLFPVISVYFSQAVLEKAGMM